MSLPLLKRYVMRSPNLLVALVLSVCSAGCADHGAGVKSPPQHSGAPTTSKTFDLEDAPTGKTPEGFTTALTGGGGPVEWVVLEEDKAPGGKKVLAQASKDDTDYRFPLCVYNGLSATDAVVSVKFKAVSGKVDQAAGLVARYKDKDNYYVTRANALEDNVRLYKVENGKRKQFAGAGAKVTPGEWHTLQLSIKGGHFQVSFDGRMLFEADDDTFKDAGNAGLWTKADSVTRFDDVRIASFDPK